MGKFLKKFFGTQLLGKHLGKQSTLSSDDFLWLVHDEIEEYMVAQSR